MASKEASKSPETMSGLSNLFEAAAALTQLNAGGRTSASPNLLKEVALTSAKAPLASSEPPAVVSDEDRTDGADSSQGKSKLFFPQRLFAMLNDESFSDVITFLPHGRSFVIVRPDVFTEEVLPHYLPPENSRSSTKYASFTRKLNRWGFRQATRGPDTGAFHHPLFRKNQPELCLRMVCQRSRKPKEPSAPSQSLDDASLVAPPNAKTASHENGGTLPPKKRRQIAPEKLPTMSPMADRNDTAATSYIGASPMANVFASVTDDSRSVASSRADGTCDDKTASSSSAMPVLKPGGVITTDNNLVSQVLKKREQEEWLKMAQASLYHNYLLALNGR